MPQKCFTGIIPLHGDHTCPTKFEALLYFYMKSRFNMYHLNFKRDHARRCCLLLYASFKRLLIDTVETNF